MLSLAPRITWFPLPDGYRSAVRVWPAVEPRARVVLVHGIISHGGWYGASCRFLAENGFEVHFLDRRGSGLNLAERGDVDRFETWLADVESYLLSLPADRPTVLLGISWGGKLALAVARRCGERLAGFGMICPGPHARQVAGPLAVAALHAAGTLGLGRRRVTIPLTDPALFTESPAWQEYVRTDPLTLRQVTVRFARADLQLNRYAAISPEHVRTPGLLVLAGRDRIIDNPRTRELFARVAAGRKTVLEYPTAAHTLEFEPDPQGYFRDLAAWIETIATTA